MKKKCFIRFKKKNFSGSTPFSCILLICLFFIMTGAGCPPDPQVTGAYCGQPGSPSIQLLSTVGLGVLRDSFCETGFHNAVDKKPQLTIVNKTNAALNVLLYGSDGTKYDFKLPQGGDNTWSLNPGSYRTELIIPGFPSMAGASMNLSKTLSYHWEIRRSEL
ncbi:Uncharacterized protein dnl_49020 [Desulfonema limicola]|uniref:Lipoprotein n=1 Tax=Desulfonema limicola TaxID=45656 RepID=A0A975BC40_9BACT|nr:hypothetical protein [Desulfonema limicola]QTA82525.1 Uncharacterized protein dnl_49020 [Desulfonema limicola]